LNSTVKTPSNNKRSLEGPVSAPHYKRQGDSMELRGKKVIALGERDGVPGPAVAECAKRAGAEVVLTLTACYV